VLTFLGQLSDGVDRLARVLLVPIGTLFILIVFLGVVTRYVLHMPIVTSVELARIGFVWAAFLGAAVCFKQEKHTQFLFVIDKATGRTRALMRLVIDLICTGFFVVLVVKGLQMVEAVQQTFFPALGWSQLWLYLPLPLCALFMCMHSLAFLARDLRTFIRDVPEGGAA
jgi:TRAP-type C4-dicarboxylate transport system permease small subunit